MFSVSSRLAAAILAFGAVACGGDSPEDWPAGRPRIDALEFLQQDARDPYVLFFSILFVDSDGDLGGGKLRLFIDGDLNEELAMKEVFERQTSPIALNATSGDIVLSVKLGTQIEIGGQLEVGFELEDARGELSNDPSVVLEALESGGQ